MASDTQTPHEEGAQSSVSISEVKDSTITTGDIVGGDKSVHYHLPESQKRVVDLAAAQARLEALPTEHIPPIADLPAGSRMPLGRNPLFVGREDDLRQLAISLKESGGAAIGQATGVTGLGGVGKTQLAIEFAHRYGAYFAGGVFWISLAESASVPAEIAACGGPDGLNLLPGFDSLDLPEQVKLVQRAWRDPIPRLLIFDNCEDESLLARHRPTTGGGRMLVTSRRGRWDKALGLRAVRLRSLPRGDSIRLLQKLAPNLSQADADDVAAELGDFPLALHLAGSYLHRYRHDISPAIYLADLKAVTLNHPSLRGDKAGVSPTGHDWDVARTFALSLDRLDPANPTDERARALLARAAWFAPGEPIPRALLLATLAAERHEAADALTRLIELGLLETNAEGAPRLHRLVAAYAGRLARSDEAWAAVETAVVDEAERLNAAGYPAALRAWQTHLRHVVDLALPRGDEQAARLANAFGSHLQHRGDLPGARPYFQQALAIRERVLGPDHPDTAESLNNLGGLRQLMGEPAGGRELVERALAIRERALGPNHPDTAESLNNLARYLFAQGDLDGARRHLERSLAIREGALSRNHPLTALSLNNLGTVLQMAGDHAGAQARLEQALAIREGALGPDHPDTAESLNNLGLLLREIGEPAAARAYLERALAIWEGALGPDHPSTAGSLHNLGRLLHEMGDHDGARPYLKRSLVIKEGALGPNHPLTANSLHSLGRLLHDVGDHDKARPYLERALAIFEGALGPDHPRTRSVADDVQRLSGDGGDGEG